jgi:hypothetical protein
MGLLKASLSRHRRHHPADITARDNGKNRRVQYAD